MDGAIFVCIDYGQDKPINDSFRVRSKLFYFKLVVNKINVFLVQAFSGHQQVNPLHNPGTVDLTADVDFCRLKNIAGTDILSFGPIIQNKFLENLMIEMRYKV